jgi:hypothetical protein
LIYETVTSKVAKVVKYILLKLSQKKETKENEKPKQKACS